MILRRGSLAFVLLMGMGAAGVVSACSSDEAKPAPGARICGLRVWHKPASREAHVEIVGDWNGWKRPGLFPDVREDGWTVTEIGAVAGEHTYAIIEDGTWLADRNTPLTAYHDGHEVALAVVEDCARPKLRVDGVDATADGQATVRASFVRATSGVAIDLTSIEAIAADGTRLTVASSDASAGTIALSATGLSRGKHTFSVRARDRDGRAADTTIATVWIEPSKWDPRDAIVYQVVLDRFRNEAGALEAPARPSERAGGTLAGLRRAIEAGEIEALGVNTLWLSPLYLNPQGEFPGTDGRSYTSYHGYWPIASRALDPRVTSEEELDRFIHTAHERSIRVLFDVVPNHVHEQHPWVSEHPDWFKKDCTCGQAECAWATHIKTCWFAPYLPDFDWTNLDVARAVTDDVMWWFDRWDADGLRIDAVPMMPRGATRRIVHAVRSRYEHPGSIPYILGENFTGPGGYQTLRYDLGPFGLDGSFHFPLMWTLRAAIGEESAPMAEIDTSFRAGEQAWDGAGAVMGMMIDNHDVARFASVSAGSAAGDSWTPAPQPLDPTVYAKQGVALATVLTLPGAPVLYYGDEVGLAGRNDPDSRRVMPSEDALIPAQKSTRELVRKVGRARACLDAMRRGALRTLAAEAERFVFARQSGDDARGAAIVALSRRPALAAEVRLPETAPRTMIDVVTGQRVDVRNGSFPIPADTFGVHVFVDADGPCAK